MKDHEWQLFELCELKKETPEMVQQARELIETHHINVKELANNWCNTILCVAAYHGHTKLCELLIEKGAEVDATHPLGEFHPLYMAAEHHHKDICRLLITLGADVHRPAGQYHKKPIDFAVCKEALAQLEQEVWQMPMEPTARLFRAVQMGNDMQVRQALAEGADVHALNDEALRIAIASDHAETVKLLLENGADTQACQGLAWFMATAKGHTEMVRALKYWTVQPKQDVSPTRLETSIGHVQSVRAKLRGIERNEDELGRAPGGR